MNQVEQDIYYLSSDELQGREMGTEGERMAAQYIAERMNSIGLEPKGLDGYFQYFAVTPQANPHAVDIHGSDKPIEGMNVIGFMNNESEHTIVIGAHYDHLGMGGQGSLHAGDAKIHNGADDNASGVALMLLLAENIASSPKKSQNNFLFIAFSGEEKGLWGSNHYCKEPTIDLKSINYMLNFDMVGRWDKEKGFAINGVGTSPLWKKHLEIANKKDMKLVLSESGVGPSDHTSFYLQDIPVLHFFTGQHEDYHKPTDDEEKINYVGINYLKFYILELMGSLDEQGKLEFTKTKDEQKTATKFTVTLGVMPDYMFEGEGMRIDGVLEDRPAQKAGFQKGDVVIQMGKDKVTDIYNYMEALSKYKKGDKTTVRVRRGEEVIKEEVKF